MDFGEEEMMPHNPFEDNPSKFEAFLYKQHMQMATWLFAISKKVEELDKRITAHERAHNVASNEAMKMSDPIIKDGKIN